MNATEASPSIPRMLQLEANADNVQHHQAIDGHTTGDRRAKSLLHTGPVYHT